MHLGRSKRIKLHFGDSSSDCFPKSAVVADHVNTEQAPMKATDQSVASYISSDSQDDGKYGSVTKQVKDMRAKTMKLLSSLSAMQPLSSLRGSNSGNHIQSCKITESEPSDSCKQVNAAQHVKSDFSLDVIDVDVGRAVKSDASASNGDEQACKISDEGPKFKAVNSSMPVIVLDSDDEDEDVHVHNTQAHDVKNALSSPFDRYKPVDAAQDVKNASSSPFDRHKQVSAAQDIKNALCPKVDDLDAGYAVNCDASASDDDEQGCEVSGEEPKCKDEDAVMQDIVVDSDEDCLVGSMQPHEVKNALFTPADRCEQVSSAQDVNTASNGDKHTCKISGEEPNCRNENFVMPVFVADSVDKDGGCHVGNSQPSCSERQYYFRAWMASQIQLRIKQHKLSLLEGHCRDHSCKQQVDSKSDCEVAEERKGIPPVQYANAVQDSIPEPQPISSPERLEAVSEGEPLYNSFDLSPSSLDMGTHYEDDSNTSESDGLENLWKDMFLSMDSLKGVTPLDQPTLPEQGEECSHSFVLKDDLGVVCCVCGVIQKGIETLFDFQWRKGNRSTRTYMPGSRDPNIGEIAEISGSTACEHHFVASVISIHPRHLKLMKPHQKEGFNFLVKNLLGDPPGGCVLAHAPGSGKTFMLISFIQSFMAKDPHARPLIILPKGILSTWRKEFDCWQVEDIPLYDFYSAKAESRWQQLEVLNNWQDNRSILLLSYKQFTNIICEGLANKVSESCQDKLLKVPTLLILDEGHTPRNDKTDTVDSLAKVKTPCKVILSGTLFQNHVEEVFNILKLVRPHFMKSETSRTIIKRVLGRVNIPGSRRPNKGNQEFHFCDLVEETLRADDNHRRKISVIQELRDMTRNVLHYYKGDFLDELPGLIDFTVLLNLGVKQKEVIQKLGKLDKFKKSSLEKAIYVHPQLMKLRENSSGDKETSINHKNLDAIVDSIDISDGVKTKFFLNLLQMADRSEEKLLVFSQYLLPLKFLERLLSRLKGWRTGKEIFVIYGDSSPEDRERSMDQFNKSLDAKIFFGSIKACGEGISLVGASRVVILDVHLNPSVTRQAIGRAFRPGQERKVYIYRLIAADSQEEEDHSTSFKKELISKMWFEWSEHDGQEEFELTAIDVIDSQDMYFENPALREDVKALYIR